MDATIPGPGHLQSVCMHRLRANNRGRQDCRASRSHTVAAFFDGLRTQGTDMLSGPYIHMPRTYKRRVLFLYPLVQTGSTCRNHHTKTPTPPWSSVPGAWSSRKAAGCLVCLPRSCPVACQRAGFGFARLNKMISKSVTDWSGFAAQRSMNRYIIPNHPTVLGNHDRF